MPKFLWRGSYTTDGVKGLMKEGGTARREAVEHLVQSLGGTLEAFYFGFGEDDLYIILDLPDTVAGAAGSLIVAASGAVRGATVVLLTPEEVDEATRRSAEYRPPSA